MWTYDVCAFLGMLERRVNLFTKFLMSARKDMFWLFHMMKSEFERAVIRVILNKTIV